MKQSISTLIIDDEELAREKLKKLLHSIPAVKLVGEANGIQSAKEIIAQQTPDLILLDIHLGKESGLNLVSTIPKSTQIIFTTAYDRYAVHAFEVEAIDYLLKPIQLSRLKKAIGKIDNNRVNITKEKPKETTVTFGDTIFINTPRVCKFLKLSSITSIDAEDSYARVFEVSGDNYLISKSLSAWENILTPSHFIRIHRSHIVNTNYVENVEKWFNYTYKVKIKNRQEKLTMSRRKANELKLS